MAHRRYSDSGDADVAITPGGTGVNLNWKALLGIITAACLATAWCMNVTGVAQHHTDILELHTKQLDNLHAQVHELDAKLNAVLVNDGLNPDKVVRDSKK